VSPVYEFGELKSSNMIILELFVIPKLSFWKNTVIPTKAGIYLNKIGVFLDSCLRRNDEFCFVFGFL